MHIVIRDDFKNVRSTDIDDSVDRVTIGSSPNCHVYLPDIRIAEEHLRLCRNPDKTWRLERSPLPDDSSANYTRVYINAMEAENGAQLQHNDEVLIARYTLNVFTDDSDAHAPRAAVLEEAAKLRAHPLPPASVIRPHPDFDLTMPAGVIRDLTTFAFETHDCPDMSALLVGTVTAMFKHFKARQVWMGARRHGYGRMEFVESRLANGRAGGDPPRFEAFTFRCAERGQFICCPEYDRPGIGSAMAIPLRGSRAILGMIYMDKPADEMAFSEEHLDLLTVMGMAIGRQLELIVRDQVKLQEAIQAGERSFMRVLQSVMDPTNVPQWEGLQLAVYCRPGLDTAGDIYDVMRLPNGLASFFCGHVTGTPTTAALAMAEVRSAFRFAGLHADAPHVLHRALNWLLFDPNHPASLASVGVVMNPKTGAMQYATAGRIGAAVVSHRGEVRSLLMPDVPEVGATRDFAYESAGGRLHEGESIVLFTPGCLTIADSAREPLGEERFMDGLADGFGQSASVALSDLLSDLKAFFQEGRQPDDITIMVLHRE